MRHSVLKQDVNFFPVEDIFVIRKETSIIYMKYFKYNAQVYKRYEYNMWL